MQLVGSHGPSGPAPSRNSPARWLKTLVAFVERLAPAAPGELRLWLALADAALVRGMFNRPAEYAIGLLVDKSQEFVEDTFLPDW